MFEVLERRIRKYGTEEHPALGALYNNIGLMYSQMEDCAKARKYYQKGLDIKLKTNAPTNSVVISLNNVALQHVDMQEYLEALGLLCDAQRRLDQASGYNMYLDGYTQVNFGKVFLGQKIFQQAHDYLQRAVRIKKVNGSASSLLEALMLSFVWNLSPSVSKH